MRKRILTLTIALVIALSVASMSSCSGKAPELDNVKDRFVYLIEGSKELNVLFFGSGLPVYERESLLAERRGVYYNDRMTSYNHVMENARYISIEDMKYQAERIYSSEYVAGIYESAFDGIMTGTAQAYLRFYDNGEWLYQNVNAMDFELSERIYDYSTMKIVKPSNAEYVNVEIESYTLKDSKRKVISLSFVYENGNWYLDSPTY